MVDKFKVGDRVVMVETSDYYNDDSHDFINNIATVKYITRSSTKYKYALQFDKRVNGHSSGGHTKYGHGWDVSEDDIRLASPNNWDEIIRGKN